jgi:hypothetical protein
MYKNRLFLGISIVSLLLMGLVVFNPFSRHSRLDRQEANDFYQRHPDWIWTANNQKNVIPITGNEEFPDYFQRHPELSSLERLGQGVSDYFERHPELIPPTKNSVDTTDYYFRHIHNRSLP